MACLTRIIILVVSFSLIAPLINAADRDVETIIIHNERITQRPIDAKQGGQFIEVLCNLIPSMLAQQVADDSFETEPPYRFAFVAQTDKPHRPWYPSGSVQVASYALDDLAPFNGRVSQKIEMSAKHARAGISQDGFYLSKGTKYKLHLHVRGESAQQNPLTARAWLHAGGMTVAGPVELAGAGKDWTAADVELTANSDVTSATLSIDFEGPGTLWLDRVTFTAADAVNGLWRNDVCAAIKEIHPGVIRWGGTSINGSQWEKQVGPSDSRAPYTTFWGGLESNLVGPEEFVQLCQYVEAEPLLCIRWDEQIGGAANEAERKRLIAENARSAAAEVEYFNGSADTPYGARRARNGHPLPYHVKYWQIGNEVGGDVYDASVPQIADAMRAVDPSIKLMGSFGTGQTLARTGSRLDYLCPHQYSIEDLKGTDGQLAGLADQIKQQASGRDVRLAVTEWNTSGGDWGLRRGTLQTLGNALACSRYQNLLHRRADLVEMAMRSNLIDSFGSGFLVTGPGWIYFSPTYYSQKLYQSAAGCFPVQIERGPQSPDMSAVVSADGRTLRVFAVNDGASSHRIAMNLAGFAKTAHTITVTVLRDHVEPLSAEGMNTQDEPRRICLDDPKKLAVSGGDMQATLDPFTLTCIEMRW